jgi:hypothetical protein
VPDPEKLLKTISRAAAYLTAVSGRTGKFVELTDAEEVLVVGDLHGHLGNFKKILNLAKLSEHPKRHVVLQELVHGVFRYNDGSDHSHRLVDVVCAYICQFPGRVHYLLGNHELAQWKDREIAKSNESLNQLFRAGTVKAYGDQAENVLTAYDELFDCLPVAMRLPNRIFLSHSLPGLSRLEHWTLDQTKKETFTEEDYKLGGCVHALVWGRDISEATAKRFLELVDCDLLISGHIPSDQGYELPNPHQIILDAKDENARVLLLSTKESTTQEQLVQKLTKLSELLE